MRLRWLRRLQWARLQLIRHVLSGLVELDGRQRYPARESPAAETVHLAGHVDSQVNPREVVRHFDHVGSARDGVAARDVNGVRISRAVPGWQARRYRLQVRIDAPRIRHNHHVIEMTGRALGQHVLAAVVRDDGEVAGVRVMALYLHGLVPAVERREPVPSLPVRPPEVVSQAFRRHHDWPRALRELRRSARSRHAERAQ